MIIQISSGQGPAECEIAAAKLFNALKQEHPDAEIISSRPGKTCGFSSIMFSTENDLSALEGTVQWICRSPVRPKHKRKNWFVDISIIPEAETVCRDENIRFERFHSGGKGG